jgi:hypothetical protein
MNRVASDRHVAVKTKLVKKGTYVISYLKTKWKIIIMKKKKKKNPAAFISSTLNRI